MFFENDFGYELYRKWEINRFGEPKGSNLGPLLFLIHINDLPFAINSVSRLFADKTYILIHSPDTSTLAENINSELVNVHEWTAANKIAVNPAKPLALIIPYLPKLPLLFMTFNPTLIIIQSL